MPPQVGSGPHEPLWVVGELTEAHVARAALTTTAKLPSTRLAVGDQPVRLPRVLVPLRHRLGLMTSRAVLITLRHLHALADTPAFASLALAVGPRRTSRVTVLAVKLQSV